MTAVRSSATPDIDREQFCPPAIGDGHNFHNLTVRPRVVVKVVSVPYREVVKVVSVPYPEDAT